MLRHELTSVVNQLLRVSHFWMEVGIDIEGVDPQSVSGVTLFFWDEIVVMAFVRSLRWENRVRRGCCNATCAPAGPGSS